MASSSSPEVPSLREYTEFELKLDVPVSLGMVFTQQAREVRQLGPFLVRWVDSCTYRDRYVDTEDLDWWTRRSYFRIRAVDSAPVEELSFRRVVGSRLGIRVSELSAEGSNLSAMLEEAFRHSGLVPPSAFLAVGVDDPWPMLLSAANLVQVAEVQVVRSVAQVDDASGRSCVLRVDDCRCASGHWSQLEVSASAPDCAQAVREFARLLVVESGGQLVPTIEGKLERALALGRGCEVAPS